MVEFAMSYMLTMPTIGLATPRLNAALRNYVRPGLERWKFRPRGSRRLKAQQRAMVHLLRRTR